jgi:hypothetical protein
MGVSMAGKTASGRRERGKHGADEAHGVRARTGTAPERHRRDSEPPRCKSIGLSDKQGPLRYLGWSLLGPEILRASAGHGINPNDW